MTHRVLYNPQFHTVHMFEALLEALRENPDHFPTFSYKPRRGVAVQLPEFKAGPEERSAVQSKLREEGYEGQNHRLILLNANASDLIPLRKWPVDRYFELAGRLLEQLDDIHIAFTGAPDERIAAEKLVADLSSPRCHSLAGKTTLRELMVLYSLADLLITNDSGPAHFAALTPIRVITLFGPESPNLFSAPTERNRALYAGLACSPCVSALNNRQSACTNNLCMQHLSVEEVEAAAIAFLKR
jgi:ADP-heptose:LPS heptosyltransferase